MKNLELNFSGNPQILEQLKTKNDSVSLLLAGGGQGCIYEAGILKVIEEMGLVKNIKAIYGNSGGTILGWNLLGNAIAKNVGCFYQEHVEQNFFDWKRMGAWIDTAGLAQRMMTTRGIDFETFKNTKTKLYAGTTNLTTGKHKFHQVPKTNLEAAIPFIFASFAFPYIGKLRVWIDGQRETDGAFSGPLPAEYVAEQSEKLLVILTTPFGKITELPTWLVNCFSGYPKAILNHTRKYNEGIEFLTKELENPDSNIGIFYPTVKIAPHCLDPELLKAAEESAYQTTKRLLTA